MVVELVEATIDFARERERLGSGGFLLYIYIEVEYKIPIESKTRIILIPHGLGLHLFSTPTYYILGFSYTF